MISLYIENPTLYEAAMNQLTNGLNEQRSKKNLNNLIDKIRKDLYRQFPTTDTKILDTILEKISIKIRAIVNILPDTRSVNIEALDDLFVAGSHLSLRERQLKNA